MGACLAAFVGHLDQVAELKASASGFEMQSREVKADTRLVKRISQTVALLVQSVIDTDTYTGGLGQVPAKIRDQHRQEVMDLLRVVNAPQAAIDHVVDEDHASDIRDYVNGIQGWTQSALLKSSPQKAAQWYDDFNHLRQQHWPPTPASIRLLLESYNERDPRIMKTVSEYEGFLATGKHPDPADWADRDQWSGG